VRAPSPRVGLGLALAGAALFAVSGPVSKVILGSGMDSLDLVSLRSLGTAVALFAITAVLSPQALRVRPRELAFLALYGLTGIAMVQWLYFVAIQRLPVGVALLFEYTAPIMVALWVRFVRRQPVRSRLWLGLALALAGLALVARVWDGLVLDPLGVLAALGAGAALACYYLMGEHGQQERDPVSLMAYSFGFSALLWAVVSPWWHFPFGALTAPVALPEVVGGQAPLWSLVLWVVVPGTVLPFLAVLLAVQHLGAARVGLVGMLEPVGGGAVAWVALGEALLPLQLLGSAVVLCGIVIAETARATPQEVPAGGIPEGVAP
jgi:drug/metabolite transporter (DMT)-like permease